MARSKSTKASARKSMAIVAGDSSLKTFAIRIDRADSDLIHDAARKWANQNGRRRSASAFAIEVLREASRRVLEVE